jgi:hypothetical protein
MPFCREVVVIATTKMRPSGLEPPRGNLPTRPSTSYVPARCVRRRPKRPNGAGSRTHRTHLEQRVLPRCCHAPRCGSRSPPRRRRSGTAPGRSDWRRGRGACAQGATGRVIWVRDRRRATLDARAPSARERSRPEAGPRSAGRSQAPHPMCPCPRGATLPPLSRARGVVKVASIHERVRARRAP